MSVFEPDAEACFAEKVLPYDDRFPISPCPTLPAINFGKSFYYWLLPFLAEVGS